jgi:hypothetical protein
MIEARNGKVICSDLLALEARAKLLYLETMTQGKVGPWK